MSEIADQRAIIDRRRLAGELSVIAIAAADPALANEKLREVLRRHLTQGRDEIRRRFEAAAQSRSAGRDCAASGAFLIDQIVRCLYDYALAHAFPLANPSAAELLTIVAVGGYGRGELAPHSDIDLLFLLPYKMTPHGEQVVEFMLYRLWDLGLKVGHAARSIDECLARARGDLTIRTALLEARYIWGEPSLFHELRRRFAKEIVKPGGEEFYRAKLAERAERHRTAGGSRYALQPDIKDGKGGLRDLQTLLWLARFLCGVRDFAELAERKLIGADEIARYRKAQGYFWTLRCHLHYLAGRAEERLTFDLQPELARRLSYRDRAGSKGVERLMKHYFLIAKSVGGLTRHICAAIESEVLRRPGLSLRLPAIGPWRKEIEGFPIAGGRLGIPRGDHFRRHPLDMLRLFALAQRHGLDIQPSALLAVAPALRQIDDLRETPEANALFLDILTFREAPDIALRRLNEAGIFGRFVPDFGRVVGQMQYDMYHHYTVDEHTIFAIGILAAIERGELAEEAPIASRVIHEVISRRVLYVAVLLHDIAKGRAGDHSLLGGEIAERLGPRLGLAAEETEQVAWLVRHHLLMSNTAFRRDIDDPKTIADFVAVVQSLERLRLLLVLTVADIRAVGPKTWNGWKAQLLRELYHRAEVAITGGLAATGNEARIGETRTALETMLADWPEADFAAHWERGHAAYWLAFPVPVLARHARLVRRALADGEALAVEFTIDPARAMTEVTILVADRRGLVAQLAGAMALSGANIVDARIFTLKNGQALDTFFIQDSDGGAFDRPARLARLAAAIERYLDHPDRARAELRAMPLFVDPAARSFPVVPRVLVDNKASATHTVIEINGRDRRGLVHDLTDALSGLDLRIASARIATFGHRAVDAFYVKDQFGLKIEDETRIRAIRQALLAILTETEEAAAAIVA